MYGELHVCCIDSSFYPQCFITCLLKNDINVSSNKLGYLLSLCSLDRVVTLLVLSEILCYALKTAEIQGKLF